MASFELQLDDARWIQILSPNGWGAPIFCPAATYQLEGNGARICADRDTEKRNDA